MSQHPVDMKSRKDESPPHALEVYNTDDTVGFRDWGFRVELEVRGAWFGVYRV